MSIQNPNSTDATMGLSLRVRVETRIAELEAALEVSQSATEQTDIEIALGEVTPLITGDLDRIPMVVASELNRWLEANKHLAEVHTTPRGRAQGLTSKRGLHGSASSGTRATPRTRSGNN